MVWMGEARGDRPRAPLGVVLAGGQGRRLDGGKATARLGGRSLASYPVQAMRAAGLQTLVVAKPDSALPDLDCRVLREPSRPQHPLCGILAALRASAGRPLVVCACDMPFVPSSLLAWLGALDAPMATAHDGERSHPLLGRYDPVLLDALTGQLERRAPLRTVVAALGARIVGADELARFGDPQRICLNVNTPADLEHAQRLLSEGSRTMRLPGGSGVVGDRLLPVRWRACA